MFMQGNFHLGRFTIALLISLAISNAALADVPEAGCFDLSGTDPIKPLQATLARQPGSSGDIVGGGSWAASRAIINRPLDEIVTELKSHEHTKSKRIAEMLISDVEDPKYLLRQLVHFEVHPFPFVNIEWNEDWAFKLEAGTSSSPERVIVAYQKASGTTHISHLCGTYVLARKSADKT
jgi:hypothetical protein